MRRNVFCRMFAVRNIGFIPTFIFFNSCNSLTHEVVIKISIIHLIIIILSIHSLVAICWIFLARKAKARKLKKKSDSYESYVLRMLMDNMPDCIYIKDIKSRFVIANKYTANVMKSDTIENLIGKTDYDFYPKEIADKFYKDEQKVIKTKKPLINIVEENSTGEDKILTLLTTKVPWYDNEGKVVGVIGIGRNITKIKKIENQLIQQTEHLKEANGLLQERHEKIQQQAEELAMQAINFKELNRELQKINETKDKFISIIAHDLKNPFNAIINFSELLILKSDSSIKPKYLSMIKIINSSSKTAYSLLENLLYWAKNQNSSISFFPSSLVLIDSIKEVVDFHDVSARIKNIMVIIESEPNLQVFADHNMVNTILRNLISNAIKFTSKNGKVKITTSSDSVYAYVSIMDTGIGLSKEQLDKLFFSDKELTKGTSGESGTGFCLLLCNEFAQQNKGSITVKSEVGKGSTFILSLPLREDPK